MTCPNDTNGDGDCGRRMCPNCGDAARAAAVQVEVAANQETVKTPVPDPDASDDSAASTVKVTISAFSREVAVEAPGTLAGVSEVALRLWRQTNDDGVQPAGAVGFMMGERSGPPPQDMTVRVLEPWDGGEQRAA